MDDVSHLKKKVSFTKPERKFLASLIRQFPVIEEKSSSIKVINNKRKAWLKITALYNESPLTFNRSDFQLRRCWENMKALRKKARKSNDNPTISDLDSQFRSFSDPLDLEIPLFTGDKVEMCDDSGSDDSEPLHVTIRKKDSDDVKVPLNDNHEEGQMTADTSQVDIVVLTEGELRMKLLHKALKQEEELHKFKVMKEKIIIEREKIALQREKILLLRAKKSLELNF